VQLELPPRVRGQGPFWRDLAPGQWAPHTEALIEGLIEALTTWPGADADRTAGAGV
jgi:hypothetical protein